MKGYLRSLLNRVHSYSKDLDTIEVFVDKPWVFKDESGNNHQYLFMLSVKLVNLTLNNHRRHHGE